MLEETPNEWGGFDGETADNAVRLAGVVKWFDVTRGFGFAVADDLTYGDVLLHFTVDAPIVLTEDTKELAVDVGTESMERLERHARRGTSGFVARVSPRSEAREKERIRLVVDTARVHFFDPETGLGIRAEQGSRHTENTRDEGG